MVCRPVTETYGWRVYGLRVRDNGINEYEDDPAWWESLLLAAEYVLSLPFAIARALWFSASGQSERRQAVFFRWPRAVRPVSIDIPRTTKEDAA